MAPRRPHRRAALRRIAALSAAGLAAAAAVLAAAVLARAGDNGPQVREEPAPLHTPPPTVTATPTPSSTPTPVAATPSPTPEGLPNCTGGWSPYRQADQEIALCYPADWSVQETPAGLKLLNPRALAVRRPEPGTGTAIVEVTRVPDSAVPSCDAPQAATVDGRPARRCTLEGEAALRFGVARSVTYVVPAGGDASYVVAAYLQDPGAAENAALFERLVAALDLP